MANEFKHLSIGGELTQAEYEAVGGHVLESQAVGDLIYATSTSQLSRLGIGATNTVLVTIGGVPSWATTLAGLTLTAPTINGVVGGTQTSATITALTISSMAGNWTNAGRTVADMGIATTIDINGGTIDGVVIGGAATAAITGTAVTGTSIVGGTIAGTTGSFSTSLALATGATVTGILDEDAMGTNSDTQLATQQSIKAYVDAQVATADTLSEVLALGNTSGSTSLVIDSGQVLTTNTINETTATSGVTIDAVLLKDNTVTATTFTGALTGNADTVTTNANLTGHVTSTGNAAVLGAFTKAQLSAAVSDGTVLFSGDVAATYTDAEAITAVQNEGTLDLGGAVTIAGNLTVNGTTTTIDTTTLAVVDPIIHLQTASDGGALGSDTNKDVGIAMQYHTGSAAKQAFLGIDDSDSYKLTFIPDASLSSEVVSGSVGTIKANLEGNVTGALTGNADTATKTATPRAINGVDFDGSAAITVTAAAGTLSGDTLNSTVVTSSLTTVGELGTGSIGTGFGVINNAAAITGTVITASTNFAGALTGDVTGNAATATKLATTRAIAVAGDVTGTANFDGSAAISITTTLANDAIVTANITNANVTVAKMAANSVDSDQYVDGSIDNEHIANGTIALAKTALVAGTNITLATNTLNVDDAFLTNTGDDTTDGTITAAGFTLADAANVSIGVPLLAGANATTTGMTAEMLAGGTIGALDAVCIHSVTQEVVIADASAVATARAIGFAPAAITDTETGTILLQGTVRDDTWTWTPGGAIYLSETGGSVTQTVPTTSGAFVQVVGVALSPVLMYFNPSMDIIELA
jgi:hypothetical protein